MAYFVAIVELRGGFHDGVHLGSVGEGDVDQIGLSEVRWVDMEEIAVTSRNDRALFEAIFGIARRRSD